MSNHPAAPQAKVHPFANYITLVMSNSNHDCRGERRHVGSLSADGRGSNERQVEKREANMK